MVKSLNRAEFNELDINKILNNRKLENFDTYILTQTSYTLIDLNRIQVLNDEFGHLVVDELLSFFEKELSKVLTNYDMAYWSRIGGNRYIIFGIESAVDNSLFKLFTELNNSIKQYISTLYIKKKDKHLHHYDMNNYGFLMVSLTNNKEDKSKFVNIYSDVSKAVGLLDVLMYNNKSQRNRIPHFNIDISLLFNLLDEI
jgi:GGDEF domain-containing protein